MFHKYIDQIPDREKYLVRAVKTEIDSGWKAGIVALREMEKVYPDDKEMLEDLVAAAVNQAIQTAQARANEEMQKVTGGMLGGMNLPGGMKFPGM